MECLDFRHESLLILMEKSDIEDKTERVNSQILLSAKCVQRLINSKCNSGDFEVSDGNLNIIDWTGLITSLLSAEASS